MHISWVQVRYNLGTVVTEMLKTAKKLESGQPSCAQMSARLV